MNNVKPSQIDILLGEMMPLDKNFKNVMNGLKGKMWKKKERNGWKVNSVRIWLEGKGEWWENRARENNKKKRRKGWGFDM